MATGNQVSTTIKMFYGVGDLANGLKSAALGSLVMFYYNQVLGLDPMLASLAILIGLVLDSVSDFLVGSVSDSTRHRWGRRHPFLYAAAIPFALTFIGLFFPPDGLGQTGLFIWLMVAIVLARTVITFYTVPHLALGAELSTNYHERTVIAGYRAFFSYIGMAAFFFGSKMLFQPSEAYPNGQLDPSTYPLIGLIFGSAAAVVILVSARGTHVMIPKLPQATGDKQRISLARIWGEMSGVLSNLAFRIFIIACLLWMVGFGIGRGLEIYLATYFWKLPTHHTFNLLIASMLGLVTAAFLWPWLSRFVGKKPCFVGGGIAFGLLSVVPPLAKVMGLFPAPESPFYVGIILTAAMATATLGGAIAVLGGSMLADIADEYEYESGKRHSGIMFGSIHVAVKAGTGVGAIMTGVLISIVGLEAQADPETVLQSTVTGLGLGGAAIVGSFGFLAAVLAAWYPITEERHREVQRALHASEIPDADQIVAE